MHGRESGGVADSEGGGFEGFEREDFGVVDEGGGCSGMFLFCFSFFFFFCFFFSLSFSFQGENIIPESRRFQ